MEKGITSKQCVSSGPEAQGAVVSFVLPQVMTVETAEALAAELKQLSLAEKTDFHLDASQVRNITTPGLQLVISLEKALSAHGGTLTICGESEAFISAFQDAGIKNMLTASS